MINICPKERVKISFFDLIWEKNLSFVKKTLKRNKKREKNKQNKFKIVLNNNQDYRINFKYDNLSAPAKPIEIIPIEEEKEILQVDSIFSTFFKYFFFFTRKMNS